MLGVPAPAPTPISIKKRTMERAWYRARRSSTSSASASTGPYLSLPLATIVAGCLFVLFSVVETRRLGSRRAASASRLEPWKTDVTVTLIHSLDPDTRARLRMVEAEMEAVAAAGAGAGEEEKKNKDKDKDESKRNFGKVVGATVVRMEERGSSADDSDGLQLRAVREDKTPAGTDDESGDDESRSGTSTLSREAEQLQTEEGSVVEYEYRSPEEYSAWESVVWKQQQRQQEYRG